MPEPKRRDVGIAPYGKVHQNPLCNLKLRKFPVDMVDFPPLFV